jgi:hypothetical protein
MSLIKSEADGNLLLSLLVHPPVTLTPLVNTLTSQLAEAGLLDAHMPRLIDATAARISGQLHQCSVYCHFPFQLFFQDLKNGRTQVPLVSYRLIAEKGEFSEDR